MTNSSFVFVGTNVLKNETEILRTRQKPWGGNLFSHGSLKLHSLCPILPPCCPAGDTKKSVFYFEYSLWKVKQLKAHSQAPAEVVLEKWKRILVTPVMFYTETLWGGGFICSLNVELKNYNTMVLRHRRLSLHRMITQIYIFCTDWNSSFLSGTV